MAVFRSLEPSLRRYERDERENSLKRELTLTIVFPVGAMPAERAIDVIEAVLLRHHVSVNGFTSDRSKKTVLASLRKHFLSSGERTFRIEGIDFAFDLSSIRNQSLDFLEIGFKTQCLVPLEEWVFGLFPAGNFSIAWLANTDYEFWQNAFDPVQYTSAGKSIDGLRTKSNGLPYPLEQTIVDVSANPGKRILCEKYIEAIGSVMWLGNAFWELVQIPRVQSESLPWAQVTMLEKGVIKIVSASTPFSTEQGECGEVQRKLRAALFPVKDLAEHSTRS